MDNRETDVKVSIIIPVYNVERFLRKCLESVKNQTLHEIEIICVDDGSTDESFAIIKEYMEADHRFKVIQKENGGLVSARKAGVRLAMGQYTGYVDSDDWIDPDMYHVLYDIAKKNQADLVSSGYYFEGNYITEHYDGVQEGLYKEEDMEYLRENAIYNLEIEDVGLRGSLCCKLFRTDLLKKVQEGISDRLSFSEDKMCVLSYILQCSRAYVLKRAFYHYIIHPASMVHRAAPDYLSKVNAVYQHLVRLYDHPYFTISMRLQAELYITELLYKGINSRLGFENRNLFWLDPYYQEDIPAGTKIVLYGGGDLGDAYRRQILARKDLELVGCVDFAYQNIKQADFVVHNPDQLMKWEYDLLLITVKNCEKASDIKKSLKKMGVADKKIRWYEQKEIFWKYAKRNGWY